MANIKSAIKRIAIGERNELQNKKYLSQIKTFIKKYLIVLDQYKNQPSNINLKFTLKQLDIVYSKIDKAKKCKALTRNTAARKKSALKNALIFKN